MRFAPLVAVVVGLSACNPDATAGWPDTGSSSSNGTTSSAAPTVFSYSFDDSVFQQSFQNLQDFSGYEAIATQIRNSVRFGRQNFTSLTWKRDHFAYDVADVEYAHAVGLTGAGQTIAIADEGFQIFGSTAHDELQGKTITTYGVVYDPQPNDACKTSSASCHGAHGTAVAAIAASDGSTGQITGVAPGADLSLVSYATDNYLAAATLAAAQDGAIVQNNSWGYDGSPATQTSFNNLRNQSSTYLDALSTFAENGVLVFGASNDEYETTYDLTAALPDFMPELEESFILVGNAIPELNANGDIIDAFRVSSACLEAARYCMVADGTVIAPDIPASSPYATNKIAEWTGTSFAAPQVSGAIALLAEAFPSLSAQELRARLLASADNGFFTHTGYVQFSQNVQHGFNDEFGHGFLNVGAALLPIGGRYVATAKSAPVSLDDAVIVSRGSAGAAVTRALAGETYVFEDGLGADFTADAASLSAHARSATDAAGFAAEIVSRGSAKTSHFSGFAPELAGLDLGFETEAGDMSVLVPAPGASKANIGLSYWAALDGTSSLGLSLAREDGSVLGLSNGFAADETALQAALSYEMRGDIAPGVEAAIGLRVGLAAPLSQGAGVAQFGTSQFNSADAQLAFNDIGGIGDRLTIGASLPQAISAGRAQVTLPVARANGGAMQMRALDVDLAPVARALDFSVSYARPLGDASEMVWSGEWTQNAGHVAGETDATLGIAWRMNF